MQVRLLFAALLALAIVTACSEPDVGRATASRVVATPTAAAAPAVARRKPRGSVVSPRPDPRTPSQLAQAACLAADGSWRCPKLARKTLFAASASQPILPASWTVPNWYIDPANSTGCASDSNSGTSSTCSTAGVGPLLTKNELRVHRWGGRPILQQSTTITLVSDDTGFSNPLAPIMDVDCGPGASLLIQGGSVARTDTFATTPNAFARTPTGRQTATATTTAFSSSDVDNLLIDTTKSTGLWVASVTSGAATLTAPRASVVPASPPVSGLAASSIAAGDTFREIKLTKAYLGNAAKPRMYPSGNTSGQGTVTLYHLELTSQMNGDAANVEGDAIVSLGYEYGLVVVFAEDKFDLQPLTQVGGVTFADCSLMQGAVLGSAPGEATTNVFSGYARAQMALGGLAELDQDFSAIGANIGVSGNQYAPINIIGNVGVYGSSVSPFFVGAGYFGFGPNWDAQGITYGTTTGSYAVEIEDSGQAVIFGGQTASTTFNFTGQTTSDFELSGANSAYGFNMGTGTFVGPTTCTFAHLDAALGSGTGFGSYAVNPQVGSRFIKGT